ncbi:hypothetical protein [Solidesulfovibrio sp.]|uniref:hypothetical protein n=1 Tax=Solidesulfovibrio sp. TaxID=2910990 RepID=UPI002B201604|nr:hypothetical protein [Solidesulfovibrio sp.]MEA4858810.1 hypothetical protein [Solidesulfovibrio sp.]
MPRRHVVASAVFLLAFIAALPGPGTLRAENFDLSLLPPILATPPIGRDSDGDGLPDLWELRGYTVNGTYVNLPAMGANPWHKDVFVWMDYMVTPGSVDLGPSQTVIDNIKAVFNNAPVTNPDGTTGIHIHPVLKNQVPYAQTLGVSSNYTQVWVDFDTLKNNSFNAAYAPSFRYMIWANTYNQGTSSGLARNIPATDFLVTLGGWQTVGGTDWQKLGTFIHELGHCLGLTHGGSDSVNYKPNYLSVMNYFFQTWGLYKDGHWGDGGYPLNFDYQRIDTPSLNKASLQEGLGLTGADDVSAYGTRYYYYSGSTWYNGYSYAVAGGIDWNGNGVIDTAPVSADINGSGSTTGTLTAQNNWKNINYSANGQIGPTAGEARRKAASQEMPEELQHELDLETQQRMDSARPSAQNAQP